MAFSVAFIGGCSAPAALEGADESEGVEPGTSESEISAKKKPKAKPSKSTQLETGCHKDAGTPPQPLTCEQVVNAAFATEGDYPGTKQNVSAAVQTCCAELLAADESWMAPHRWDCCANLPADAGHTLSIACTPWGPPVPPKMRRRAEPKPESWLEVA